MMRLGTRPVGRVVVIGNAKVDIELTGAIDTLYVFNDLRHLSLMQWAECSKRIIHVHNSIFSSAVKQQHAKLSKRCPDSHMVLVSQDSFGLWSPWLSVRNTTLPPSAQECFLQLPNEGGAWTVGFFLLSRLASKHLHRNVPTHGPGVLDEIRPPELYGFNHFGGKTHGHHPVKCEKQAVDAWVAQGEILDHRSGQPGEQARRAQVGKRSEQAEIVHM